MRRLKKADFKRMNETLDSSIPAPSTTIGALKSPFFISTDNLLSNMRIKEPKIYNAGGDINKQWAIISWHVDPKDGKLKRIRKMHDINTAKTLKERQDLADAWLEVYKRRQQNGWNYFSLVENHISLKFDDRVISCIDIYLKEKKGKVAKKTYDKYNYILKRLKDWCVTKGYSSLRLADMNKRIILSHLEENHEELKWSNKTYNNTLLDISTFFNHFIKNFDDILTKNPLKGVTRLTENHKGHTAYSDQQVIKLKEAMEAKNPYLFLFVQTVYETCTRPQSETRLLKCGMFDLNRGLLRITSDIAKNNSTDFVPLRKEFIEKLKEHGVHKADPDDYLFTRYRKPGKAPMREETIQGWYADIKKELGLGNEYTIYSWKHTRNIHVWLDTKDVMFIKTLNRHKTLEMTMKYLRDLGCFVDNNEILNKTRQF